jgi:drug/metabolite transporter (DMT)-like permease
MLRLLCGAFLISFASVFVKLVQTGPTATMFFRFLFGGLGLLTVTLVRKEPLWRGWHPTLLAFGAGAAFAMDLFFWHRSILYVGPGLATILANFQVFALALVGCLFLKERLSWQFIVAVPLAFVGLFMIVGWDVTVMAPLYRLGIVYGLLTAVCYTCVTLLLHRSRRIPNKLSPGANMALVALFGALVGGLAVRPSNESFAVVGMGDLGLLVAYGIICSGVGWMLIAGGLGVVSASAAGLVLVFQPTCAFIWDILIFDRPTTALQMGGALMTLGAIYLGSVAGSRSGQR